MDVEEKIHYEMCNSFEITMIMGRVAFESSPGERFGGRLDSILIHDETELLVHWLVLMFVFFCFLFVFLFALHGGNEPHYSCETQRVDVVQPQMAHTVVDELGMVLLASYQLNKITRGFVKNRILTA